MILDTPRKLIDYFQNRISAETCANEIYFTERSLGK